MAGWTAVLVVGTVALARCGASGSSTDAEQQVVVTGTVEAPGSAAASVAVVKNVGLESPLAAIAVTDLPVSGGTVTAKRLDGTILDEGIIGADGAITGLAIDPTQLDSTKQVLIDCTSTDAKRFTSLCDLTSAANGSKIDCGKTNADSTLAVQQIYYQADPTATPDDPTALAAKIATGDLQPLALFKIFKGVFDVSSAAGTDDAASAYQAIRAAFRAAFTSGTPPKLAEINQALQGGAILNTWKALAPGLATIDMGSAVGHVQNYIPAVAKTFADPTTYQKFTQTGDAG